MKQGWIIAATLSLMLPCVPTGLAAMPQEEETLHFTGVVLAVDVSREVLTVEQASAEAPRIDFTTKGAKITKDGKELSLASIEVGDPVSVEYRKAESGNQARGVSVLTTPAS